MTKDRIPYLAIACVAIIGALAFFAGTIVSSMQRQGPGGSDIAGLLWPEPPTVGDFSLRTGSDTTFTKQDLLNKWTFVFFGFTHCPDVCPTSMQTLKQVSESLAANETFRNKGQVLFVSVDPERDTPQILRQYVKFFDDEFIGATAEVDALKKLTSSLGILFAKIETPGAGDYTLDHSASILLIDPEGRMLGVFTMPHLAPDIAERFVQIVDFYMES